MKNYLLITITLLIMHSISSGQTYFAENSKWTVYLFSGENFVLSKYQMSFLESIEINGRIYRKLYYSYNQSYNQNWDAIREEGGKIYTYMPVDEWGKSEDVLLYDFTLKEGDFFQTNNPLINVSYKVSKIGKMTLESGEERKIFYLSICPDDTWYEVDTWIEGIGSIYGFMSPVRVNPIGFWDELVCFKQDDNILYRNENRCKSNCCDDITPPNSQLIENPIISEIEIIQKNNFVTIDFPEIFSGEKTIQLLNTKGNILFTKTTDQDFFELNISGYSQGIYLISIQNGSNIEYFKFVK